MSKKKKYKLKRQYLLLFEIIIIIISFFVLKNIFNKHNYIKNIKLGNNNYIVSLTKNNLYCILSNKEPDINDINWIKSNKKECKIGYKPGIYNIYIKNKDKIYNATNNEVYYLKHDNNTKYYIALDDKIKYINDLIGNINKLNIKSKDKDIAFINDNGYIVNKNKGETTIEYNYNESLVKIDIISTDLIVKKPNIFDFNKPFLECNQYTKIENDLFDEILKYKINNVGFKTRAAAVEAARFLTLEFPYKVPYFHENGRQTTNKVDGEGRYYHEGLFLNESRYKTIKGSATGPKTWGCSLYSNPRSEYMKNGLDCSGFVSWALLNAGFDVKDVGAGFKDGKLNDLTDFGELKELNNNSIKNIKVGDLLHSNHAGGHIAIIIGIDDKYYYVAQALWREAPTSLTKRDKNDFSVQITKYTKNELINVFPHVVLMDKYYKNDGNLTKMW